MASQNNVTKNAQRNVEEQGHVASTLGATMPAHVVIVLITAAW